MVDFSKIENLIDANYSEQLFYKHLIQERIKTMGLEQVQDLSFRIFVGYRSVSIDASFQGIMLDAGCIYNIYNTHSNRVDYIMSVLYAIVSKLIKNPSFKQAYADGICEWGSIVPIYYIGFGLIIKEYWSVFVPSFEIVFNSPRLKFYTERVKVNARFR